MRFEVTVYRHGEGVTSLLTDAASAEEAGRNGAEQGYEVVSVRELGRWSLLRPRRRRTFDVVLFSQELKSLLEAGLSLIESLSALSRKEGEGERRRLIDALIRQLREGKSFSAALRQFPEIFPPLYLALMATSEQTGELGGALGRFIDYRGRMDAVKKRITAASIYPAMLLGVGGFVILFLMTYVVPRFSRVYEEFGANLPVMSRLLLEWGALIEGRAFELLVAIAVAAGAIALFARRVGGWRGLLRAVLRLRMFTGLRSRFRAYALARFYRTLGLLLEGGIPAVTALGMARELLDDEMRVALDGALVRIRGGVALSEAMEEAELAPPVAGDLLRIGERTGNLGEKMMRIADFHDEETARWADWFARLFEPLLMLTIGMFIAFIVVLLYMPIFELAGSVQ